MAGANRNEFLFFKFLCSPTMDFNKMLTPSRDRIHLTPHRDLAPFEALKVATIQSYIFLKKIDGEVVDKY